MTDASNLANDVARDVVDEVDVGSALTGGDVTEDLDGESLGRSIGETLGETVGRLLGRGVVNWVLSKLAFWSDDDPSLSARFGRSLLLAVGRTLKKPEFKEPIGDALRGFVDSLEARGETAADAAGDAAEQAEDAAESAGDTAEEAADAAAEEAENAAEKLAAGDMDELRKETYRELLEMMEYSKIQSIAKESGVKANLSRDEMIDDIVDNFDEDADASEGEADGDADSDAEEADDGEETEESTESDESDDDESS
ncbi:hypothetical protein NDI76_14610 [Halogeometricum sp. S1BR25-6]|uniref:Rho termination factor N-terminal domain-containing protein n=1 Tax=Halogeometricum salsisoli TaxID=2950536 RepID=A0ABU2GGN8_9EURY|nr:hypothetical protein [Halogeometricum sp. S1BR25-6]MDS0299977.1 hypothetical protein [Halogeometricum sp. S1BR25-6]